MPKKIGSYVWKVFIIILFIAVSTLTLFFAYGYQVDFGKRDIRKTSIIDVAVKENGVSVLLDGTQESNVLPYQIKGVLPGDHLLSVQKNSFQPWQRKVDVAADIVTIVNDVLLVPDSIENMVKPLAATGVNNGRIYAGENFMVTVRPGEKSLDLTTLYDNGTSKEEQIELYKSGITGLDPLSDNNFMLYFDDGSMAWVDFRSRRFLFFKLPKQSGQVKVNSQKELLYFTRNNVLYGVPFSEVDGISDSADKYQLLKNVDVYVPVLNGDIYFLSGGTLFKSDYQGHGIRLADLAPAFYKNIGYEQGNGVGALMMRDKNDRRYLLLLDAGGRVLKLVEDLKGQPFFNSYDQMIYAKNSGEIFFYDWRLDKTSPVNKLDGDFEILGWFTDEGYFIFKTGGKVQLSDVFNANTHTLIGDLNDISAVFVLKRSLFYIKSGTLYSLSGFGNE